MKMFNFFVMSFVCLVIQAPVFAQLQNFEIKKKEVSNPKLDSLCECYRLFGIEEIKQKYSQKNINKKSLEEYIKEDSISFFKKAFKGKTQEQYIQESLEDIKRFKGTIEYLVALKQVKKGKFPLPKYNSSAARLRYERMIKSEEENLKNEIQNFLQDTTNIIIARTSFKKEMDKLKNIPNKEWIYIFDTLQLGGNNPILYPGEYVSNNNDLYKLLMDHNENFYHIKSNTRILSMPIYKYDFWFRRLNGGTKIIIPNYQNIKNLVTDEYVSLDSLTEADLILARENKNDSERIDMYAKVSDDLIFAINSSLNHDWDFIDVSGDFDKVRPNASLLSDSTLYEVTKKLMMKWRHFKEEGTENKKVEAVYHFITKEDYIQMKKVEKDFPEIEAEHRKAVDKGFLNWISYSSKVYADTYSKLMGLDPQIGLSVKELKNYVVLSEVPKGSSTYYKIKHILNKSIYEIIVDNKGIITAYNLITY